MAAARKSSRYGHRDATMILIGYRHGLRASELCDLQWSQLELAIGRLHVRHEQPGGMITGFGVEEPSMGAKWVELLRQIAPRVESITLLFNPAAAPFARMFLPSMQALGSSARFDLIESPVGSEIDVDRAIT